MHNSSIKAFPDMRGKEPISRGSLSISIVIFQPGMKLLARTVESLARAVAHAVSSKTIGSARLTVVDNGNDPGVVTAVKALAGTMWKAEYTSFKLVSGHGNVGYGMGHNLGIGLSDGDYHLVLNPDVLMAEDALTNGVGFLAGHGDVGLVTPKAEDGCGRSLFLNRRYPDLLTLLLRGGMPFFCRDSTLGAAIGKRLDACILKDMDGSGPVFLKNVLASGCFMLFRKSVLDQVGGFSREFFLYFEDYDLSIKIAERSSMAYVPDVRIVHFGGGAGQKGLSHILMFVWSAVKFFNKHGWKVI